MNVTVLADEIINGRRLRRGEEFSFFFNADLDELCSGADHIRAALCGNHVDLCSIINGKSGRCSENCKFCAQSARHCTGINEYSFLDEEQILAECRHNAEKGVAFRSGANAAITGDMLTTSGSDIQSDMEMLSDMDFDISVK